MSVARAMISFGPDTDVPATPLQRAGRTALIAACSFLGLGVVSSVARLATEAPSQALAPARFVAIEATLSAMAAGRPARPAVELVHDVVPANAAARGKRVAWMLVTAYCPCPKCCGRHAAGLTASGRPTTTAGGHFVAGPAGLPFGSKVIVPGYNRGRAVAVLDRGGAIKGDRLDVFFPTHDQAKQWGRRWVAVTVVGG